MKLVTVLITAALLIAGCDSGGTDATESAPPTPQAQESLTTDEPTSEPTERDTVLDANSNAEDVIRALQDAGQPIGDITIYTEANDPNDQMGDPGAYTSKGAFADNRVDTADVKDSSKGSIDLGGGVEVFDSEARAKGRAHYIEQAIISTGGIVAAENDIVAGGILLRLSGYLPASAVLEYQDTLSALTGVPAKVEVKA